MKARADAVKNYLVTKYKIDPSRISTTTGSQTQGEAGRTVGVDKK